MSDDQKPQVSLKALRARGRSDPDHAARAAGGSLSHNRRDARPADRPQAGQERGRGTRGSDRAGGGGAARDMTAAQFDEFVKGGRK